eukprot:411482-Pleurochrysis_carterae.AAC.2
MDEDTGACMHAHTCTIRTDGRSSKLARRRTNAYTQAHACARAHVHTRTHAQMCIIPSYAPIATYTSMRTLAQHRCMHARANVEARISSRTCARANPLRPRAYVPALGRARPPTPHLSWAKTVHFTGCELCEVSHGAVRCRCSACLLGSTSSSSLRTRRARCRSSPAAPVGPA